MFIRTSSAKVLRPTDLSTSGSLAASQKYTVTSAAFYVSSWRACTRVEGPRIFLRGIARVSEDVRIPGCSIAGSARDDRQEKPCRGSTYAARVPRRGPSRHGPCPPRQHHRAHDIDRRIRPGDEAEPPE